MSSPDPMWSPGSLVVPGPLLSGTQLWSVFAIMIPRPHYDPQTTLWSTGFLESSINHWILLLSRDPLWPPCGTFLVPGPPCNCKYSISCGTWNLWWAFHWIQLRAAAVQRPWAEARGTLPKVPMPWHPPVLVIATIMRKEVRVTFQELLGKKQEAPHCSYEMWKGIFHEYSRFSKFPC